MAVYPYEPFPTIQAGESGHVDMHNLISEAFNALRNELGLDPSSLDHATVEERLTALELELEAVVESTVAVEQLSNVTVVEAPADGVILEQQADGSWETSARVNQLETRVETLEQAPELELVTKNVPRKVIWLPGSNTWSEPLPPEDVELPAEQRRPLEITGPAEELDVLLEEDWLRVYGYEINYVEPSEVGTPIPPAQDVILATNPLGLFKFDELAGTVAANDGSGVDGAYVNSPELGQSPLVPGDSGKSVRVKREDDGTERHVNLGASNAVVNLTTGFGITFVNRAEADLTNGLVYAEVVSTGSSPDVFLVRTDASTPGRRVFVYWRGDGPSLTFVSTDNGFIVDENRVVSIIGRPGNVLEIYINGQLAGSTVHDITSFGPVTHAAVAHDYRETNPVKGIKSILLDYLVLHDTAPTAGQIAQIHNRLLTG